MKNKNGHITNSSSSSFIVSKKHVDLDKLKGIIIEITEEESRYDEFYEPYSLEEFGYDVSVGKYGIDRYWITDATEENPYYEEDEYFILEHKDDSKYTNHYIVDNDSCIRYNWGIIEKVFEKYGIPFEYGYCD